MFAVQKASQMCAQHNGTLKLPTRISMLLLLHAHSNGIALLGHCRRHFVHRSSSLSEFALHCIVFELYIVMLVECALHKRRIIRILPHSPLAMQANARDLLARRKKQPSLSQFAICNSQFAIRNSTRKFVCKRARTNTYAKCLCDINFARKEKLGSCIGPTVKAIAF